MSDTTSLATALLNEGHEQHCLYASKNMCTCRYRFAREAAAALRDKDAKIARLESRGITDMQHRIAELEAEVAVLEQKLVDAHENARRWSVTALNEQARSSRQ